MSEESPRFSLRAIEGGNREMSQAEKDALKSRLLELWTSVSATCPPAVLEHIEHATHFEHATRAMRCTDEELIAYLEGDPETLWSKEQVNQTNAYLHEVSVRLNKALDEGNWITDV